MFGMKAQAAISEGRTSVPVALGAALGLLFIVPFLVYYRPPPMGDFHVEWLAVVLLALAIAGGIAAMPRGFPVRAGPFVLPATLALIVPVQLALDRYAYLYDWVLWLGYLGVFSLSMLFGQALQGAGLLGEVTRRMAWAIVLTSLTLLFTQLAQIFRMEQALSPFVVHLMDRSICRIHGNIGQANQATTMAWFGVAAALYLMQTRHLTRVVGLVVVALLLLSSALTASRMAWLFGAIAAAALFFWFDPEGRRSVRKRLSWALALLVGFAIADAIAVHLIRLLNPACESGLERIAGESGSFAIRWNLWRQALLVWTTHPWFGVGAGNFLGQVFVLDHAAGHQPLDSYAHNSLLQLLAEFGVFGAATAIGVLAWGAWSVLKMRDRIDAHRLLLLVWVAILLTYSMLEFPLWYMHFLILFGLSVGLLVVPDSGLRLRLGGARVVMSSAVLALLAGCAYAAYDYRKAERGFYLIMDAQAMRAIGTPQLAVMLDGISRETTLYRVHLEYALGTAMLMTKDHLQAKLEENERLVNRVPLSAPVARQILLLTMAGDLEDARWYLHRLLKFSPPETTEAIGEMRRLAKERPENFAALSPILEEEVAKAPKSAW